MKDARIDLYLQILACVLCGAELTFEKKTFVCSACKTSYPYIDGIAVCLDEGSEHITKQADIYDKEYAKTSYGDTLQYWQQAYIQRTGEIFGLTKANKTNKKIYLDVGAGPGHTIIELCKKNVIGVGCDISLTGAQQAMKLAKKRGVYDRCLYVVCDATHLPFKPHSIDYASCIMLLEHLEKDYLVVKSMAHALRGGGLVYVAVPNTYWHFWPFLWPINYWHDKRLGHLRHYSGKSLEKLMKSYKLSKVSIFYSAHLVKFVQLFYSFAPKQFHERLWWGLEHIDEMQHAIPTGLHLNGVFKKEP